jgi:hypothetical protein
MLVRRLFYVSLFRVRFQMNAVRSIFCVSKEQQKEKKWKGENFTDLLVNPRIKVIFHGFD